MPYPQIDRFQLEIKSLRERKNKVIIERDQVAPDTKPENLSEAGKALVVETREKIIKARKLDRPVMLAFGAHTIKNGLAPVLISLIEAGWVTHLATNGAGIIHDWEFAFQGESSEEVKTNVSSGRFGIWQETGFYLNLALVIGAYEGRGYGESVGAMIHNEGLNLPSAKELREKVIAGLDKTPEKSAASADLLGVVKQFNLKSGFMQVPHPFKHYSIQAAAFRLKVPFTGHPMIGHDIIYNHPLNQGAAIGRTALRDFLSFAYNVSNIQDGVYLSVGSAVMSPMVFEKAFSMAQNLAIRRGSHIDNHFIVVVDLAKSDWDWQSRGEPPRDNPAYYLRYCKTFSRMGGTMRYLTADNRDFLLALYQGLPNSET